MSRLPPAKTEVNRKVVARKGEWTEINNYNNIKILKYNSVEFENKMTPVITRITGTI
jgi:hypothetical protein